MTRFSVKNTENGDFMIFGSGQSRVLKGFGGFFDTFVELMVSL